MVARGHPCDKEHQSHMTHERPHHHILYHHPHHLAHWDSLLHQQILLRTFHHVIHYFALTFTSQQHQSLLHLHLHPSWIRYTHPPELCFDVFCKRSNLSRYKKNNSKRAASTSLSETIAHITLTFTLHGLSASTGTLFQGFLGKVKLLPTRVWRSNSKSASNFSFHNHCPWVRCYSGMGKNFKICFNFTFQTHSPWVRCTLPNSVSRFFLKGLLPGRVWEKNSESIATIIRQQLLELLALQIAVQFEENQETSQRRHTTSFNHQFHHIFSNFFFSNPQ